MRQVCEDASDAGHDSGKANDRVQGSDHLRELNGRNAPTDDSSSSTTQRCDSSKLRKHFGREADCRKGSKDSGPYTKHTQNVTLSCGCLRRQARDGAYKNVSCVLEAQKNGSAY